MIWGYPHFRKTTHVTRRQDITWHNSMYVVQPCYFINLKNMRKWLLLFATLVGLHIQKPSQPRSRSHSQRCNRRIANPKVWIDPTISTRISFEGYLIHCTRARGLFLGAGCAMYLWWFMGDHGETLQTISTSHERREDAVPAEQFPKSPQKILPMATAHSVVSKNVSLFIGLV